MLSVKALLYYYLGGNITAFIIYDEELKKYKQYKQPYYAQELYYYAKTAKEIGHYDAQNILDNFTDILKKKVNKNDEENYYLAQLYFLDEDEKCAKEIFEQSTDFLFSKIMLKVLSGEEIPVELTQNLKLDGEIDYNQDISQFYDYIHYIECVGSDKLPFWERFYLSDTAKYYIDELFRKAEAEKIKAKYKEELEKMQRKITTQDIEELESKAINRDAKLGSEFINIKNKAGYISVLGNKISDYEKQIVLSIYDNEFSAKSYLTFIYYAFYTKKIDSEQCLSLMLYLRHKTAEKFNIAFIELVEQGFKLIPYAGKIFTGVKVSLSLLDLFYDKYKQQEIEETTDNSIEYEKFKEVMWQQILIDYNANKIEKSENSLM
jgi:hypothetical protein